MRDAKIEVTSTKDQESNTLVAICPEENGDSLGAAAPTLGSPHPGTHTLTQAHARTHAHIPAQPHTCPEQTLACSLSHSPADPASQRPQAAGRAMQTGVSTELSSPPCAGTAAGSLPGLASWGWTPQGVVGWQGSVVKLAQKPLWGSRIPRTAEKAFESFSLVLLPLGPAPVTLHSLPQGACKRGSRIRCDNDMKTKKVANVH